MPARLGFNYLICVYLPGFPVSLLVYFWIVQSANNVEPNQLQLIGFFTIITLINGMFIDGIKEILSRYNLIPLGNNLDAEKLKKNCYANIDYNDALMTKALDYYLLLYYACQFFANIGVSIIFSLIMLFFMKCFLNLLIFEILLWIFIPLLLLSIPCFFTHRHNKDEHLNDWFGVSNEDKSTIKQSV